MLRYCFDILEMRSKIIRAELLPYSQLFEEPISPETNKPNASDNEGYTSLNDANGANDEIKTNDSKGQHHISVPLFYLKNRRWKILSKNITTSEDNDSRPTSWWQYVNWVGLKQKKKCDYILSFLRNHSSFAQNWQYKHFGLENQTVKLLITDSADYGSGNELFNCIRRASKVVGAQNVHFASRRLVHKRDLSCFNIKKQTCLWNTSISDLNGTVWDYKHEKDSLSNYIHNGVIAKWDFPIRQDITKVMDKIVGHKLKLERISHQDYFHYRRTLDVAHFWNVEDDKYSQLRNSVTTTIQHLIVKYNFTGTAGLVSKRGKEGRNTASDSYATAMLEHKIIVVAQRDKWEDHLRLMEALSSGAMVISDPVTHLPADLKEGKNILIFNSLEELIQKVVYYLSDKQGCEERIRIAKAGREVAMEQHLPRNRFERLVFGENWPTDWRYPVASVIN